MATRPERVYWDSCVYIDCIQKKQPRFTDIREVYEQAKRGEILLIASSLVIAEVVKCKWLEETDGTEIDQQEQLIREFFQHSFIKVRMVDRTIAEHAASIGRQYRISPPDAIHVATAIFWDCATLQTYDGENGEPKKLLAFNGKISLPAKPSLKIQTPQRIALPRDGKTPTFPEF